MCNSWCACSPLAALPSWVTCGLEVTLTAGWPGASLVYCGWGFSRRIKASLGMKWLNNEMELQGGTDEWVEQKAPVIERMFQFWPGDRVNWVTSVLVGGGEGGRGDPAGQGRVGGQTLLEINRRIFLKQTGFFGVGVQQMDERPHPQVRQDRGGETRACRCPPLARRHFLQRLEASLWGRVQKEKCKQNQKGRKKTWQDVHAADAYKLWMPLISPGVKVCIQAESLRFQLWNLAVHVFKLHQKMIFSQYQCGATGQWDCFSLKLKDKVMEVQKKSIVFLYAL